NGDPRIVGSSIRLNSAPYVVVGVMKPDFNYPSREFDLWVPLTVNPYDYEHNDARLLWAVARLKPGVTIAQAQADMDVVAGRIATAHPETNRNAGVRVVPLLEDT